MKKRESKYYWRELTKFISGEMNEKQKELFSNRVQKIDEKKLLNQVELDMKNVEMIKDDYKEKVDNAWTKLYGRLEENKLITEQPNERKITLTTFSRIVPKGTVPANL